MFSEIALIFGQVQIFFIWLSVQKSIIMISLSKTLKIKSEKEKTLRAKQLDESSEWK